jgi:RNA polymerase sigma factor (sigma-70 family)
MRGGSTRHVLRHLQALYRCGVTGHQSDEELLERFLAQRDEAAEEAFTAIVQRHGPMVLGVCLRVLGDRHEAEDAFQATFLVLARKAASVIRRDKVANWLYGVACRTAQQARGRTARRRAREERVGMSPQDKPSDGEHGDELRGILDEELARLPARYRAPIVLCELEGLSRHEAARRLGVPEGTISSRLARAKNQLRDRLARRGLGVPMVALSAALVREASAASLSDALIESTAQAAMCVAAGSTTSVAVAASVVSLTEGVLKTMLLTKLKGTVLSLGTLGVIVSGAVVLGQSNSGPMRKLYLTQETKQAADPRAAQKAMPSDGDETDTVERKLDRILKALDRLAGGPPGTGNLVARDPFEQTEARRDLTKRADPSPEPGKPEDQYLARLFPHASPLPREGVSISQRLTSVEKALQVAQDRLQKLETRLTGLEKHVGVVIEGAVSGPKDPAKNPASQ